MIIVKTKRNEVKKLTQGLNINKCNVKPVP